ncbi:hypothetical protein Tco_0487156 [Tanacetum coccineum]
MSWKIGPSYILWNVPACIADAMACGQLAFSRTLKSLAMMSGTCFHPPKCISRWGENNSAIGWDSGVMWAPLFRMLQEDDCMTTGSSTWTIGGWTSLVLPLGSTMSFVTLVSTSTTGAGAGMELEMSACSRSRRSNHILIQNIGGDTPDGGSARNPVANNGFGSGVTNFGTAFDACLEHIQRAFCPKS